MSNINQTENAALSVNFVQAEYFLERIHGFEVKYRDKWQGWGAFLSDYSQNLVDRDNSDLDEWAFLCNHFMGKLIESARDNGPPGAKRYDSQKPEGDSGFCFLERVCSTHNATSRTRCAFSAPARAMRKLSAKASKSKKIGIHGK
jgi:hypothetical protein